MALFNILKLAIFINLTVFITFIDGQAGPISTIMLKTEPSDVEIKRGTEVNLECVFDQPAPNCSWLKNGITENNIQFIGSKDTGNCSIRLTGNDEVQGKWQCIIPDGVNSNSVLSREAKITLIASEISQRTGLGAAPVPTNKFIEQPENTTVRSGDNTILKCIFRMDQNLPVEKCYWESDGGVIEMGGRYSLDGDLKQGDCSITITNANIKRDNNRWFCGLPQSDAAKPVKSRTANLTVAVAPSDPKILKDDVEQVSGSYFGVQFGQSFTVTCSASNGNPEATLKWTMQGNELPGTVSVTPGMGSKLVSVTNELTTTALQDWKNQQLTCTSSHPSYDVGQERTTYVILSEFQKTLTASIVCQNSTDSKRTLTLKANENGEFTCNGDGVPKPEYRWQVKKDNKWEKLMDNVQNLTVFSKSQEIRCTASNDNYQHYADSQSWTIVGTDSSGTNLISGTRLIAFFLSIWVVKHVLN